MTKAIGDKRRGGRRQIDWLAIQKRYVENPNLTIEDMTKEFPVSYSMIAQICKRQGWTDMRKRIQEQAVDRVVDKVIEERSAAIEQHGKVFKLAEDYITARVNRWAKKLQRLNVDDPDATGDDKSLANPQQVKFMMEAYKIAVDGRRTALGLPTIITKTEADIKISNEYSDRPTEELHKLFTAIEGEVVDNAGVNRARITESSARS